MSNHLSDRTVAADLTDRGREQMNSAKMRAQDGFDRSTTAAGESIERAGDAIEAAGRSTAGGIKRAGRYMQDMQAQTIGEDMVEFARQHPGTTLCTGIGIGLLIGRALRRPG